MCQISTAPVKISAASAACSAQRARSLAPGRDDYAFEEARLRVERTEYEEARRILKELMTWRFHKDVRANARKLLEQVDDFAAKQQSVYRRVREGEKRT